MPYKKGHCLMNETITKIVELITSSDETTQKFILDFVESLLKEWS